jgi:mRNA-degrading endonuclease RelE of RelBE toxin-antitoxin system
MAKTSYTIAYAEGVGDDLAVLRASERRHVMDAIDKQLTYEPTRETRNRKLLRGLIPPWQHVEPVWELRIGQYRVFYDVDVATGAVTIRALRHKPPHKTTEEIL